MQRCASHRSCGTHPPPPADGAAARRAPSHLLTPAPALTPACLLPFLPFTRSQSKHGQLMAVGRAREGGIEVAGTSKLLGYTAFEDIAGGASCWLVVGPAAAPLPVYPAVGGWSLVIEVPLSTDEHD